MKAILVAVLFAFASLSKADTFEFRFWPPSPSFSDPRVTAIHEGPCGPVATARVERMPQHSSKEPLAPERVLEISPNGTVLSRWRIPVDALVLGVVGQELFFQFNSAVFRVGTDGAIAREALRSFPARSEVPTCNAGKHFSGSAYASCWRHRDAASGVSRLLAYEGPCT